MALSIGAIKARLRRSNAALFSASIGFAILFIEIGLRIAGISYPEFNRLDTMLGWSPRPGVSGIYAVEGRTEISINLAGFRDINHQAQKPSSTLRIAVLGDSFAEGREVSFEQLFWKVMEVEIAACLPNTWAAIEVINFAVNGYGTGQQVLVLENIVPAFQPDLVLLTIFTGNDITNNSRELDGHPDRPYFELEGDDLKINNKHLISDLFLAKRNWSELKIRVFNTLRSAQVIRQAYVTLKAKFKYSNLSVPQQLSAGLNINLYKEPKEHSWEQAWLITEALIKRAAESTNGLDAKLILTTLSNPIQVTPDFQLRTEMARKLGVGNLFYPDRRLAEFANQLNIPVFNLAERLAVFSTGSGKSLHGRMSFAGGHWNAYGHRIAGQILGMELCKLLNQSFN